MTLVLSCATEEFTVQVCDRRITIPETGRIVDPDRNKGVQYHNHMIFSYSGFAMLDGERSDVWLAERLQGQADLGTKLQRLKAEANAAVARKPGAPSGRRHAFVGVGFGESPEYPGVRPVQIIVSNAIDEDGRWTAARTDFLVAGRIMSKGVPFMLGHPIGAGLSARIESELRTRLARRVAFRQGAYSVAQDLAWAIREVASRNRTVGAETLASVIPRSGLQAPVETSAAAFTPAAVSTAKLPVWFLLSRDGYSRPRMVPTSSCPG